MYNFIVANFKKTDNTIALDIVREYLNDYKKKEKVITRL